MVAVRPDWTGSEFLFGYEDALLPQRGGRRAWHVPLTLRFMLDAAHDPDSPYILVLDEMNLAHVERYFADMLSGMESRGDCLPNLEVDEDGYWREVSDGSARLPFPRNVFIVGTVNIDETTHMFSPKVLDRANTFEFRVSTDELNPVARVPRRCEPAEARLVAAFVSAAVDDDFHLSSDLPTTAPFAEAFRGVHDVLARHGFEFGHRVYYEGIRFAGVIAATGEERPEVALDLQVLQKVLPRIHGARRRVEPVLLDLAQLTFTGRPANGTTPPDPLALDRTDAVHPRAFDKICRMIEVARMNQFTSYTG